MRFIYFLLNILLQYPLRIYYPKQKLVNAPKRFFGRTIYVCNHASSFMDPLVIGVLQRPIIHFMVRSDVFNKFTIPIFNSAQMLPIFREQDGEGTKEKNEIIFKKCGKILSQGKNLLIFGEGFTDDVFIRRLKPVKKGAVRIGFLTLENLNWKKKIYLAAIGINYADPNVLGSELIISNSDRICLNDYKISYLENPTKTINDVNKLIEKKLQEQITHVEDKNWVFFHEHVMRLRRNGLDPNDTDCSIYLEERWKNSKALAHWMNEQYLDGNLELVQLKEALEIYFKQLSKQNIKEKYLYELDKNGTFKFLMLYLKLFLFSPFAFLGLIHFYVPYKLVKNFSERVMKRPVFWSSVKMFLGSVIISLWNIPIMMLVNSFFIHSGWISFGIYMILPFVGILAYRWMKWSHELQDKKRMLKLNVIELLENRKDLLNRIGKLIPLK
jgi:hypothetical protein